MLVEDFCMVEQDGKAIINNDAVLQPLHNPDNVIRAVEVLVHPQVR